MHVEQGHAPPSTIPDGLEPGAVADQLPMAAAIADAERRVLWTNRAFRVLVGWNAEPGRDIDVTSFFDPEASGWVLERIQRTLAGAADDHEPTHAPLRTLQGERFDGFLRLTRIVRRTADDADPEPLLLFTVSPTLAMRYDHHPFRRALELQQELVCEWSPTGTVLYANRAYRSFFSLGTDIVGRSLDELLERRGDPPLDGMGASIRENILRGIESSNLGYRENRTYPNGRTVEWTNTAVRDDTGAMMSVLAVGRDVTDRTATETELRRNEERFRLMATQIWDTILLVSPDGRVIDSTAQYRTDLDRDPDYWHDLELATAVHPDDRAHALAGLHELLELGPNAQLTIEVRAIRANGEYTWLELNGTNLLHHPSMEAILLLVRNIDERKEFERQLAETRDRERQGVLQREAVVTQVSHELRNLVHGTLGLSEILARADVPLEIGEVVTALHRQSLTLRRIVDDLLDAAQIGLGAAKVRDEAIDLAEMFSDIELTLAGRHVPVVAPPPDAHLRFVMGDVDRLRQALTNLLSNALRHTTDGEVRVQAEPGRTRDTVRITVADTGTGIDIADIDRLFKPGERGHDERSHGIGLGLSVAKSNTERMGGAIGAIPRSGGATFWLELRAGRPADPTPMRGAVRPASADEITERLSVLVIDDDSINRLVASMQLRDLRADVITAADADEGLRLVRQRSVDAVLCDLNMSGNSGLHFLRELRQMQIAQPFVTVMTGDADPAHRDASFAAGADHYLLKPATLEDLADTLVRCVERRS
ncbi:MAG: hypothetical protein RL238_3196 [Actinomycetota bacterium]